MITKKNHKIKHILNNSSIIVDGYLTENILMGKGIGFGKRPGDTLPRGSEYEKSYQLLNKASDFHRIINGYDENIVIMVMDTIQEMMAANASEFTANDLVTIADHLAAMFERVLKGEAIVSFFSKETKTLYNESFKKAEHIAGIIYKTHKVIIPEAEVAYIALYLENLSGAKTRSEVAQISAIIVRMDDLFVQDNILNIDKDSIAYSRLLIHINLIVQASGFRKAPLNPTINKAILSTYRKYEKLAQQLFDIIEEETNKKLSESELIYLVIHLVNLFDNERE